MAIADALAVFPADAILLAVHTADTQNWREEGLGEKCRARFDLPLTEMFIDGDGQVVSVTTSRGTDSGDAGSGRID